MACIGRIPIVDLLNITQKVPQEIYSKKIVLFHHSGAYARESENPFVLWLNNGFLGPPNQLVAGKLLGTKTRFLFCMRFTTYLS